MEVVANVTETCEKEAEQKPLLKGSHVHMDILMNHLEKHRKGNAKSPEQLLKTTGSKRQKCSPNVVFVDDFDKCVIRNTKSVGIVRRKCQLKRRILVERADIVTWRSSTLDVLHAQDMDRQQLIISQMLARR